MRLAPFGRAFAKWPAAVARLVPLLREVEMYRLKHESGTEALVATVLTYGIVLVITTVVRALAKRSAVAARLDPLLRELTPADQQLAAEMYGLRHESITEALVATVLTYGIVLIILTVADAVGMATVGIPASFNAPVGAAGLTLLHWVRWLRPTLRTRRTQFQQLAELRPDLAEVICRAVISPHDLELMPPSDSCK